MRVAIMQPYFMPYAGYFRLLAAADVFVVLDDVQINRRGFVHRNRLRNRAGELDWLTLPLVKAPRDTLISQVHLAPDADAWLIAQSRRFPALAALGPTLLPPLAGPLTPFLVRSLHTVCRELGIYPAWAYSSALPIPPHLRGADRIIAIVEALGGTEYLNAPGGRHLYNPHAFAWHGIDLTFLPPYEGDTASILERLAHEPAATLHREITGQIRAEAA